MQIAVIGRIMRIFVAVKPNITASMKKSILLGFVVALMGLFTASCNKDDVVEYPPVTTAVGKTVSMPRLSGDQTGSYLWKSDNDEIGTITMMQFTALHVGQTMVRCDLGKFTITVRATTTLYSDLCWDMGASPQAVKDWMTANRSKAKIESESADTIVYSNVTYTESVTYNFEGGKLKSVVVIVNTKYADKLTKALEERYVTLSGSQADGEMEMRSPRDNGNVKVHVGYSDYIVVEYTAL